MAMIVGHGHVLNVGAAEIELRDVAQKGQVLRDQRAIEPERVAQRLDVGLVAVSGTRR